VNLYVYASNSPVTVVDPSGMGSDLWDCPEPGADPREVCLGVWYGPAGSPYPCPVTHTGHTFTHPTKGYKCLVCVPWGWTTYEVNCAGITWVHKNDSCCLAVHDHGPREGISCKWGACLSGPLPPEWPGEDEDGDGDGGECGNVLFWYNRYGLGGPVPGEEQLPDLSGKIQEAISRLVGMEYRAAFAGDTFAALKAAQTHDSLAGLWVGSHGGCGFKRLFRGRPRRGRIAVGDACWSEGTDKGYVVTGPDPGAYKNDWERINPSPRGGMRALFVYHCGGPGRDRRDIATVRGWYAQRTGVLTERVHICPWDPRIWPDPGQTTHGACFGYQYEHSIDEFVNELTLRRGLCL
jgi:hypothetical protein